MIETYWQVCPPNTHFVTAWLVPEPLGGYSVRGINLPDCVTAGATKEECLRNLEAAAKALIESYLANGEQIPWAGCDTWAECSRGDDWHANPPTNLARRISVTVELKA